MYQLIARLPHRLADGHRPGEHGVLRRRWRDDRGQATTEYALVLLAAALVALLVVAWATAGGGAKVARLFSRVIDSVIEKVWGCGSAATIAGGRRSRSPSSCRWS